MTLHLRGNEVDFDGMNETGKGFQFVYLCGPIFIDITYTFCYPSEDYAVGHEIVGVAQFDQCISVSGDRFASQTQCMHNLAVLQAAVAMHYALGHDKLVVRKPEFV